MCICVCLSVCTCVCVVCGHCVCVCVYAHIHTPYILAACDLCRAASRGVRLCVCFPQHPSVRAAAAALDLGQCIYLCCELLMQPGAEIIWQNMGARKTWQNFNPGVGTRSERKQEKALAPLCTKLCNFGALNGKMAKAGCWAEQDKTFRNVGRVFPLLHFTQVGGV